MFTVNKEDTIWRWHCSGVFFLYFEHVSGLFLMFLLFTLKNQMFSCLLAASLFTQKLKKHLVCGNSKWLLNGNVHCLKIVSIQSYSGMYFPTFGLNTEILCILSEYRKIQTRTTLKAETFHTVVVLKTQYFWYWIHLTCFNQSIKWY